MKKRNKQKLVLYLEKGYSSNEIKKIVKYINSIKENDIIFLFGGRLELIGHWSISDYVHMISRKIKRWLGK